MVSTEKIKLALDRKSVVVPSTVFDKPTPAAFIQNLQGVIINRFIIRGVYVYEPKQKAKKGITKGFIK